MTRNIAHTHRANSGWVHGAQEGRREHSHRLDRHRPHRVLVRGHGQGVLVWHVLLAVAATIEWVADHLDVLQLASRPHEPRGQPDVDHEQRRSDANVQPVGTVEALQPTRRVVGRQLRTERQHPVRQ